MGDLLSIRRVAEETGLAAGTIRMWEQRYGFPEPQRTPSGYRQYREGDVEALRRVQAFRHRGLFGHNDEQRSSPSADRPDGQRLFSGQLDFFRFMADHETFTLTQRICHRLQADLDLQHLAAVRQGEPKYSVFLRRATWPE